MSSKSKGRQKDVCDPVLSELEDFCLRLMQVLDQIHADWRAHFGFEYVVEWVRRCWPLPVTDESDMQTWAELCYRELLDDSCDPSSFN